MPWDDLSLSAAGVRAEGDGRQGIHLCHAQQIINGNPLVDRVLAPRSRAMRDGRDAPGPEAVAIIHERLGTGGQRRARDGGESLLERGYHARPRVEPEGIANEVVIA